MFPCAVTIGGLCIMLCIATMYPLVTGLVNEKSGVVLTAAPRERRSKSGAHRPSSKSGRSMVDIEECAPDRAKGGVTCFTCESISPLQAAAVCWRVVTM